MIYKLIVSTWTQYSYAVHRPTATVIKRTEEVGYTEEEGNEWIVEIDDDNDVESLMKYSEIYFCGDEIKGLTRSNKQTVGVEIIDRPYEYDTYFDGDGWDVPEDLQESWVAFSAGDNEDWDEYVDGDYLDHELFGVTFEATNRAED